MKNDEITNFISSNQNYLAPQKYISGRITEYDISQANINMLIHYGKIDRKQYEYLSKLPKHYREVEVGLLIKQDIEYYNCIEQGIIAFKIKLFEYNKIDISEVVRIANDAVFINRSTDLKYTLFDNVLFKKKSVYNSMIVLDRIIVFFWYDNNGMNIEVKGLNENAKLLHLDYMLSFIANVMYLIERVSINDAIRFVSEFYDEYINLRLPIEYYRELNPESLYKHKETDFYLFDISIDDVDINYNLYIIREIWSILLTKYNVKH